MHEQGNHLLKLVLQTPNACSDDKTLVAGDLSRTGCEVGVDGVCGETCGAALDGLSEVLGNGKERTGASESSCICKAVHKLSSQQHFRPLDATPVQYNLHALCTPFAACAGSCAGTWPRSVASNRAHATSAFGKM